MRTLPVGTKISHSMVSYQAPLFNFLLRLLWRVISLKLLSQGLYQVIYNC